MAAAATTTTAFASEDNDDDNPTRFSDEDFESLKECANQGYEDGQDNPFDHEKNRECDAINEHLETNEGELNTYYQSFIDGCMSVEGNTREICESATD